MTSNELYQNALSMLNGTNGFSKNVKKGWQTMAKAAANGSQKASAMLGEKAWGERRYEEVINQLDKNNAKELKGQIYANASYIMAKKKKSDVEYIKGRYNQVRELAGKNDLNGEGYWYLALITQLYKPSDLEEYNTWLDMAAFLGSDDMTDAAYKSIGRTRNVFSSKEEFDIWMKRNKDSVKGFVPIQIEADQAWVRAQANLDGKEAKKILGFMNAKKLSEAAPKAVLEYEQVIRCTEHIGTPTVQFKHQDPNYSTINTGSFDVPIDRYWYNIYATYKTKQDRNSFSREIENIKLTNEYREARFRFFSPYTNELVEKGQEQTIVHAYNGIGKYAKEALHKKYNWNERYITHSVEADSFDDEYHCYYIYVPYWFFTLIQGAHTYTVRVNAYSGECDYFVNNPYGEFVFDDDIMKNGGAKLDKDALKEKRKKSKGGFLSLKVRIIIYVIVAILEIILMCTNSWPAFFIVLAALIAFIIIYKKKLK